MKMLKLTARLLTVVQAIAFAVVCPEVTQAANPHTEWRKLETEHFEIIFDSRHYQLAKDFARHAETAWATLVPVMRTWPDKTAVVIEDDGDQANGMATGFPYPQIHLYPATPAPGETIGDTGPWELELITHEYTHVLNFQPAHGVFHTLRNIFGTIVRPNILLPRWYLEGLAVEMETRFSPSGGRLRSPDFMAIPRAMVQDNILRREDVARIGETGIPDWPGGARPYLMGGLVWEKLARENLSIVGDLNDHFARRFPFFIDQPLIERTGTDWQGYLESVYTEIEARAAEQIEEICENGCVEGQKLGEPGFYSRSPVLSRNSAVTSLAYLAREHNHDSVVFIVDREPSGGFDLTKAVRAAEPTYTTRVAWLPDAKAVVYDGVDSFDRYEDRVDLWLYDRERKKKTRLTNGLRAREPDVSLDGSSMAYVQLSPGRTQIVMAPFARGADGKPSLGAGRVLYTPYGDNRVSWPTFVSLNTLVFVERSADGKEVLKAIDFQDATRASAKRIAKSTRLPAAESGVGVTVDHDTPVAARTLSSVGNVTFPRLVLDSDGRRSLLFASNRSGVTNLYQVDLRGDVKTGRASDLSLEKAKPITNSTTRAWNGDFDVASKNLIYARLDGDGSRLRILTPVDREQNETLRAGKLVQVPLLIERPEPVHVVPEITLPASALEMHDLNVWPYMLPRYWMPYGALVPGGAFLSASTSSGDPVGRHVFSASVSTDTRIGKPNFYAAYSNATTDVHMTVMATDFWQRLSSSGLDRRSTTADGSGLFFLPGLNNDWKGEVGVSHQRTETPSSAGTDVRIQGGPRLGILWQDMTQKGYEIAPEKGGYARLAHARFVPELGNLVYDKTDFTWTGYASQVAMPRALGWLPERHVLNATVNVSWLPALDQLLLAPSSVSLPVETVALGPSSTSFIMRGYPTGAFLAKKLLRGSVEYHLPLSKSYHGFGTSPAFIRRWHGVVFGDLMTVEGALYDFGFAQYRRAALGNMFGSVGVEARLDSTMFYHVPVQFIFGVHYGIDQRVNPNGAYPILSVSL
jgi:hypothetical protein